MFSTSFFTLALASVAGLVAASPLDARESTCVPNFHKKSVIIKGYTSGPWVADQLADGASLHGSGSSGAGTAFHIDQDARDAPGMTIK